MSRLTNLLCTLVSLAVFLGLTTQVSAGVTPAPCGEVGDSCGGQNLPCCSELSCENIPMGMTCQVPVTPTATPVPTPEPSCLTDWPEVTINTLGKGNSPTKNNLVKHEITGHIIDPTSLLENAHRILVCQDSFVRAVITTPGGFPANNTALGSLDCTSNRHVCEGTVSGTEVYRSVNDAGSDTDRMQLVPR